MILQRVGLKWVGIAAVVLAVGLISVYVIRSTVSNTEDRIEKETIELQIEKRERIDDAVRNSPPARSGDASDSLQFLRDRQSRSD